jgi:hypothetical protein
MSAFTNFDDFSFQNVRIDFLIISSNSTFGEQSFYSTKIQTLNYNNNMFFDYIPSINTSEFFNVNRFIISSQTDTFTQF